MHGRPLSMKEWLGVMCTPFQAKRTTVCSKCGRTITGNYDKGDRCPCCKGKL